MSMMKKDVYKRQVIQVPIFIEEGEKIQIDTRTGEYLGRSK